MTADEVARERAAAAVRHETEQRANGQRRAQELAAELQAEARRFRVTVTAPDGGLTHDEVVPRDELIDRVAALEFVTEQLPGWTVAAEPIET